MISNGLEDMILNRFNHPYKKQTRESILIFKIKLWFFLISNLSYII